MSVNVSAIGSVIVFVGVPMIISVIFSAIMMILMM